MSAIAKRYARAGVEAAYERGGGDAVEVLAGGMSRFVTSYEESAELRELIANPVFRGDRDAAFRAILATAELQNETASLLLALLSADRMPEIVAVEREVKELADERAGRVRACVQSVVDLSDAQKARIAATLSKRLGCDVVVEVEINPSLMGGLVCQVGDLAFDSSLKRQLELIRDQLQSSAN